MNGRIEAHVPSRPTWRCRACGIAWPCSPAKLNLLATYREDKPALMVHLVELREEAAEQLAGLAPGEQLPDLHRRFTDWVPVRSTG
ncbi:flavin reductase [Micromonospora palythoicola]|uniref:flavin reductase n=1 Tax=Micromonospora palythoicola TaxID=3120507 RepID=UPI002FCE68AF